jgi:hypothetical protein
MITIMLTILTGFVWSRLMSHLMENPRFMEISSLALKPVAW